ncbi:MAG: hypothetical protein V3T30_00630 [Thermodesulfobacteriota bacterium]
MESFAHGSSSVMGGKLKGATDTDYFNFFCPDCGGSHVLQLLNFKVVVDGPVEYDKEERSNAKKDFILAFELYCRRCGFKDFVKVSNLGWQEGEIGISVFDKRDELKGNPLVFKKAATR